MTRFVTSNWAGILSALRKEETSVDIACPFVTEGARGPIEAILATGREIRLLTRFREEDAIQRVQNFSLLADFADRGMDVRGVRDLHAKVFMFGRCRVLVGSLNLTGRALDHNHEAAILTEDTAVLTECAAWFASLWKDARTANSTDLRAWQKCADDKRSKHSATTASPLDRGGISALINEHTDRAFVKFLGRSKDRLPMSTSTRHEIAANVHRNVWYPSKRTPKQVKDGDRMFIARLAEDREGHHTMIFGRAMASAHDPGRDEATALDIERQPWMSEYRKGLRLHDAEILAGTLSDGIHQSEMLDELGYRSFRPTFENHARGKGNLDPRMSIMQKPHMQLTAEAHAWLDRAFDARIARNGLIPDGELKAAGWIRDR